MSSVWLDFFNLYLWLNFLVFIISLSNLINLLLFCELFWVILFLNFSILSAVYNSILIFLLIILILTIATVETSIGLSITILKSSIYGSITKNSLITKKNIKNFNSLSIGLVGQKLNKVWKK